MLHGGGVFHLEKRVIKPSAIPVPLHWFMWQSYTTWISGVLLLISVFYLHGGSSLLNPTSMDLQGWKAIGLSAGGILGWWLVYDTIWRSKLKEHPMIAVPLTLALILATAAYFNQFFNGRAVFLQIGAMTGSAMSANVFFHIIQNQKKFMKSLLSRTSARPEIRQAGETAIIAQPLHDLPGAVPDAQRAFPAAHQHRSGRAHPRRDHRRTDDGEMADELPLLVPAMVAVDLRDLHSRLRADRPLDRGDA